MVEFRVRVCDFGQKVPCPPVVRTNDVSVRNDEQYFFRHDHSLVRSIAMLVRTAGPNIFRDQPGPGSKPGRPSERCTYAASRTAGLTHQNRRSKQPRLPRLTAFLTVSLHFEGFPHTDTKLSQSCRSRGMPLSPGNLDALALSRTVTAPAAGS